MSGGSYNSRASFRGSHFGSEDWSTNDCCTLTIADTLSSPNMAFFQNQRVGDIVMIGLENETVVLFDQHGNSVASIISAKIDRLKHCLHNQYTFNARITAMSGAKIDVYIYCIDEG